MSEVKNLPASVRQRLLNKAHDSNRPFNEMLQFYAIERFLYRISLSGYSDQFILKGALIFLAWKAEVFRPTRDIDLLGYSPNELEPVARIFQDICLQEVEPDGLLFDSVSVRSERINQDADYEGVRVTLLGFLGKIKIPLQIDIGFADVVFPAPVTLLYPTILRMPPPQLRSYTPESIAAEKLHALVILGDANSRMKDFYDLWVLAEQFEFDGRELQQAIHATFRRRNTELPDRTPIGLSSGFAAEKQPQWLAFLRRTQLKAAPELFSDVSLVLNRLLLPPLLKSALGEKLMANWKPGGPWLSLGKTDAA